MVASQASYPVDIDWNPGGLRHPFCSSTQILAKSHASFKGEFRDHLRQEPWHTPEPYTCLFRGKVMVIPVVRLSKNGIARQAWPMMNLFFGRSAEFVRFRNDCDISSRWRRVVGVQHREEIGERVEQGGGVCRLSIMAAAQRSHVSPHQS